MVASEPCAALFEVKGKKIWPSFEESPSASELTDSPDPSDVLSLDVRGVAGGVFKLRRFICLASSTESDCLPSKLLARGRPGPNAIAMS